jgi:hypothetical protein
MMNHNGCAERHSAESFSMIKTTQILPLAAFGLVFLCGLNPAPNKSPSLNKSNEQSHLSLVEAPDSTGSGPRGSFTDADFARHVDQLKKKLASGDFTVVIQPPFVVIGDEPPDAVKGHAENTIKWAVDKLKQDYFSRDPKEILDIWLF